LSCAAALAQLCGERKIAQEHVEVLRTVAGENGFAFFLPWVPVLGGSLLVDQRHEEEGITQIQEGLSAWQTLGAELLRAFFLTLLAEAYGKVGHIEKGLRTVSAALTRAAKTEERFSEAELYRLKGELLLQHSKDHPAEAEACFHTALEVARQQSAKSWELRAATSLARLWQRQGKQAEAHDLLAPVYHWFTEGFDTADLQEAKVLLVALS
jgi:predicted ATPase